MSSTAQLQAAADYLARTDPALAPIIQAAGLPRLRQHHDHFRELVVAIVSQQVSTKAAKTIYDRLEASFGGQLPSAQVLAETPIEHLREVGISGRKSSYIIDLAQHISDGRLDFKRIEQLDDTAVTQELTAVKGIGVWTAHVFMIFCLGRPDILAIGDLGIRAGVQKLCQLEQLPSPEEVTTIAQARGWSPYQSAACWYLWRMLDEDLLLYDSR